jgi:hypothetical protein
VRATRGALHTEALVHELLEVFSAQIRDEVAMLRAPSRLCLRRCWANVNPARVSRGWP